MNTQTRNLDTESASKAASASTPPALSLLLQITLPRGPQDMHREAEIQRNFDSIEITLRCGSIRPDLAAADTQDLPVPHGSLPRILLAWINSTVLGGMTGHQGGETAKAFLTPVLGRTSLSDLAEVLRAQMTALQALRHTIGVGDSLRVRRYAGLFTQDTAWPDQFEDFTQIEDLMRETCRNLDPDYVANVRENRAALDPAIIAQVGSDPLALDLYSLFADAAGNARRRSQFSWGQITRLFYGVENPGQVRLGELHDAMGRIASVFKPGLMLDTRSIKVLKPPRTMGH
jgi:hypothetical protein